MQNKSFVIILTAFISLWCLYMLSFTFISRKVQKEAIAYATSSSGDFNPNKKQAYLDSVWNKPVYDLGFHEYTYKDVKNNEISLGLDLQGGMHVTLEISPINIIKGLSVNKLDSTLNNALRAASVEQKKTQKDFSKLFFDTYRQQNPGKRLAPLFSGPVSISSVHHNQTFNACLAVRSRSRYPERKILSV